MAVVVNRQRAEELGDFLKSFGTERISLFETRDPQYRALEKLYRDLGDCGSLALLTVLNSLVSYQLSVPGEEYWWEFASYRDFTRYVGDPTALLRKFRDFLLSSRGNTAAREKKLERIERVYREEFHIELYVKTEEFIKNMDLFVSRLSEVMRQSRDDKTIVFSAKMLYYVSRICGIEARGIEYIKIPVDRRVAAVSYTSEIVDVVPPGEVIEEIMREKRRAIEAWEIVSNTSSIPMIRLDSLVWFMGRYAREKDPVERASRDLEAVFRGVIERQVLLDLARQFLRRRLI